MNRPALLALPTLIVAGYATWLAAVGGAGSHLFDSLAGAPSMGLAPAVGLVLFAAVLTMMSRQKPTGLTLAHDLGILLIGLATANYVRLGLNWYASGVDLDAGARLSLVLAGGGGVAVAALAWSRPRIAAAERWWRFSPALEMPRLLRAGSGESRGARRFSLATGLVMTVAGMTFMGAQTVERSIASFTEPMADLHDLNDLNDLDHSTPTHRFRESSRSVLTPASTPISTSPSDEQVVPDHSDSPGATESTTSGKVPTKRGQPVEELLDEILKTKIDGPERSDSMTGSPAPTPQPALRPTTAAARSTAAAIPPQRGQRAHRTVDRRPTPAGGPRAGNRGSPTRSLVPRSARPNPSNDRPRLRSSSTNLDLIEEADAASPSAAPPNALHPRSTPSATTLSEDDPDHLAAPPASPVPAPKIHQTPRSHEARKAQEAHRHHPSTPVATESAPALPPRPSPETRHFMATAADIGRASGIPSDQLIGTLRRASLPLGLGLVLGGLLLVSRGLTPGSARPLNAVAQTTKDAESAGHADRSP